MVRVLAETGSGVVALNADPFENEGDMQTLLARFPELVLAGRAADERPPIWTIGREVPVPSGSIDLLLIDGDGRVWVVETKLDKNPEVRKHVVGQVLAYAADVALWSAEDLVEKARPYLDGAELADHIDASLGAGKGQEVVERAVGRLASGDLTALVVVDELNSVLRRLVEFVNRYALFELLAVQVQVVTHEGGRLFFPTVVGEHAGAKAAKTSDGLGYGDIIAAAAPATRELEALLDTLADAQGWQIKPGPRSKGYGLGNGGFLFRLYPQWDTLEFYMQRFRERPDLDEPLRAAMAGITAKVPAAKHPSLPASALVERWDHAVEAVLLPYAAAVAEVSGG